MTNGLGDRILRSGGNLVGIYKAVVQIAGGPAREFRFIEAEEPEVESFWETARNDVALSDR